MIEQEKVPMLKYAMHYGAILGLFWIVKYLFIIIGGFAGDVFIYLSSLLSVGTFLLVYVFYFKYRNSDPDRPKGIIKCILFVAAMAFFASIFEGAIMYMHYELIHPEFFDLKVAGKFVEATNNMENMWNFPNFEEVKQEMYTLAHSKSIYIASQFLSNIVTLTFVGLVIGLLGDKRKAQ